MIMMYLRITGVQLCDKISVIEFYLYDFKVEAIDEESEFLNDN